MLTCGLPPKNAKCTKQKEEYGGDDGVRTWMGYRQREAKSGKCLTPVGASVKVNAVEVELLKDDARPLHAKAFEILCLAGPRRTLGERQRDHGGTRSGSQCRAVRRAHPAQSGNWMAVYASLGPAHRRAGPRGRENSNGGGGGASRRIAGRRDPRLDIRFPSCGRFRRR